MLRWMVWFPLKLTQWTLCLVGAVALLITAMVATPVSQPPELVSISKTARAVDRSTMPGLQRFHGSDGTELAYRHYPARGQATGQIAIVVHGSSGSSVAIHALSDAIAARGVDTSRHPRPWWFGHPWRCRLSRPARGRHGRLRGRDSQDQPDRPDHAARPFRRRRLCAPHRRFADPESVRPHRPACALSRA
jgi:hypothetical protein